MSIACAIFDFDGTLFDTMPIWDTAGEKYLRALGCRPKSTLREDVRAMSLEQAARYLQTEYGLSASVREITEGINGVIAEHYRRDAMPKPGVPAFLEQMRRAGIPMCIATATDRYLIEAALERCHLAQYFQAIFTCGEVGRGKDSPLIFQKAMAFFGADRSSAVIFEDALHAIETAWADGFRVVAVRDDSETRQDAIRGLSECYITSFEHPEHFWRLASA